MSAALIVLLSLLRSGVGQQDGIAPAENMGQLLFGQIEKRTLEPGGHAHAWRLDLSADEYIEVDVRQINIDVVVRVSDVNGVVTAEFDTAKGATGSEHAKWISGQPGVWSLLVASSDTSKSGSYEIEWGIRRAVTNNDRLLLEADRLERTGREARQKGRYSEAEPPLRDSLKIREEVLGAEHPDISRSLNDLALVYLRQAKYDQAEPLYQRSLAIREKALGPEHPDVAESLNDLALLFQKQGKYQLGEPLYRRSLAIFEKALGAEHPHLAFPLANLANLYTYQGKYEQAEPLYQRSLAIREKALGPEHPDVAISLNNLANLYRQQGKYAQAEPAFQRSLAIFEKALGAEHPNVATLLNNLAHLHERQGKYEQAEPLYRRSLAIQEKTLGPEHPGVANTIANLAGLYTVHARYEQAEPLYRRSLAIREKVLGAEHPRVAISLSGLAVLYGYQGKFEEAEPLFRRSLAIREKALGPEHPRIASSLSNLAGLYTLRGRYEQAEPLYQRSLAIREKALGVEHPDTARSLNELGLLYLRQEKPQQAEPFFRKSLTIREKALGREHPRVAQSLRLYAQSLWDRNAEGSLQALPLVDRAIRILDSTTGDPVSRIQCYSLRSRIHKQVGDASSAVSDLTEALRSLEELRPHLGAAEETRARQLERYREYFNRMVVWQLEANDLETALSYADRGRARSLLDQLEAGRVNLRSSIPPDIREQLESRESEAKARLAEYQQRITLLRDRKELDNSEKIERIRTLEATLRNAQMDYQRVYDEIKNASPLWRDLITAGGHPVSLATIQRRLIPRDGLLLYYLVGKEQSYVFVVPPAGSQPQAFPLRIENEIAAKLKVSVGDLTTSGLVRILTGKPEGEVTSHTLRRLGELPELSHLLWQILVPAEIRPALMEASEVIVIPDGHLHLLAFESLVVDPPTEGNQEIGYWLDQGPVVRYAASATTLYNIERRPDVRMFPRALQTTVLSLSNPVYSPSQMAAQTNLERDQTVGEAGEDQTLITRDAYERLGGVLRRLPGTARESEAIRDAFQSERGGNSVMVLQGMEAGEKELRANLAEKRYLHLATHGLVGQAGHTLFSALALAPPIVAAADTDNDGFLQLFEIYDLKIPESELAVLSACETNVGERFDGEGVFGLSRGFMAAGARRVIASQWAVDDESTAVLIGHLFRQIAAQERQSQRVDYARALRDAKLAVRRQTQWADPYFWAPFILIGKR